MFDIILSSDILYNLSIPVDVVTEVNSFSPEYSFDFQSAGNPTIGFATKSNSGPEVEIAIRDFLYDSYGDIFFNCLETISKLYLNSWLNENNKKISCINNCIIQISPENRVFVDINCRVVISAVAKESIQKGETVVKSQIADIRKVKILNVLMRKECGKIFIFSNGWRRGVYFDLSPLLPKTQNVNENIETTLATCYALLMHPEIADIYPKIKDKLFERGWFPFIQILGDPFSNLSALIKDNINPNSLENEIVNSFDEKKILKMLDAWMTNPFYKEDEVILKRGIDMYLKGDYIGSAHILFLRIEGLLRSIYLKKSQGKPHSYELRQSLREELMNKNKSANLFLPHEFDEFLRVVYFQGFDLSKNQIGTSRNSIAHGVIKPENFSKVSVFQAILVLDQIFYYT